LFKLFISLISNYLYFLLFVILSIGLMFDCSLRCRVTYHCFTLLQCIF